MIRAKSREPYEGLIHGEVLSPAGARRQERGIGMIEAVPRAQVKGVRVRTWRSRRRLVTGPAVPAEAVNPPLCSAYGASARS